MLSDSLIFMINVSPNLLKIRWRFSFDKNHPNKTSIGNRNDFPKLLITIPFKSGFFQ